MPLSCRAEVGAPTVPRLPAEEQDIHRQTNTRQANTGGPAVINSPRTTSAANAQAVTFANIKEERMTVNAQMLFDEKDTGTYPYVADGVIGPTHRRITYNSRPGHLG